MRGDGRENDLLCLTSLLGLGEGFSESSCTVVYVFSVILRWIRRIFAWWATIWGSTCWGLSVMRWGSAPATTARSTAITSAAPATAASIARRATTGHFRRSSLAFFGCLSGARS